MAEVWATRSETTDEITMRDGQADAGTLSLHVLARALWGEEQDFANGLGAHKPAPGYELSYKDALREVMKNVMLTVLFDAFVLPYWLTPASFGKFKLAESEFQCYMEEEVADERQHLSEGGSERENLASMLVSANERAKSEYSYLESRSFGFLSDSKLYGNFFMFNFAGHETLANSISYSIACLGSHIDIQEWVGEGVDASFGPAESYQSLYPRLVRTITVMYETLRVWDTVQNHHKYTGEGHPCTVDGKTYLIPPSSCVSSKFPALHKDPALWGKHSLEGEPGRWIASSSTSNSAIDGSKINTFGEYFAGQPEGAVFVALSHGLRECPEKKFSRVEFVACLAFLLKSYRIFPARRGSEQLTRRHGGKI